MGLPLYIICFLSITAFSILSLFSVLVVLMIICPGRLYFGQVCLVFWRLPVPEWAQLSLDLGNYYFIEYIMNHFCLDLFSFFNAHDSQVWSFDGVNIILEFLARAIRQKGEIKGI
jgi:hypothetical protein